MSDLKSITINFSPTINISDYKWLKTGVSVTFENTTMNEAKLKAELAYLKALEIEWDLSEKMTKIFEETEKAERAEKVEKFISNRISKVKTEISNIKKRENKK